NGRELLAAQLPGVVRELEQLAAEIIVVDNGSDDGTAEGRRGEGPRVEVEVSSEALSVARAVNRGIRRARYSHVCLLNNDMSLQPGFFGPLGEAFDSVPDLFCATAQIRFPEGVRREETGKAVMAQDAPEDFPIRCDLPMRGEDLSYVLYGSGGCSVYDAAKLRALGELDEAYEPAYVEDLDIGYRAWQHGWPTVYVGRAVVEHRHRATTSRYYTPEELDTMLEVNYLRFLARAVAGPKLFRRLWKQAVTRLRLGAARHPAMRRALEASAHIAIAGGAAADPVFPEESFLALTDGSVAVFPGRAPSGKPRSMAVAATPRGRRGLPGADQVIVAFTKRLETPPAELLASCVEVVLVQRRGKANQAEPAFQAALRLTARKWQPAEAHIISREMTVYSPQCAPAKIVLSK
ncbi:MAG TPA: glycosyltransferase, partial [Candidatus Sulfopaludibacter sp.]|nr:glycosyltransferase [Candidatus Sulfopaludibacter sp.]